VEENANRLHFLIASNFVVHSQILIFLVFQIASLSPYWLQIKFSMWLFFYLFTFNTINLCPWVIELWGFKLNGQQLVVTAV